MTAILLRKFNLNYIEDNSFIFVYGMIHSGKSMLIKDIIHHKNIPIGMVISDRDKYEYIPPIFIHNKTFHNPIKNFIKNQAINVKDESVDSRSFLIINYHFLPLVLRDKYYDKLLKYYKKLNSIIFIENSFIEKKFYKMAAKFDYIFIFKQDIISIRKDLYDYISSIIQIEFTVFCKLMDDYTGNFNCLVVDMNCKSNNLQDKFYWFRADMHYGIQLCCKESWTFNKNNLMNDFQEEDENYFEKIYKRNLFI